MTNEAITRQRAYLNELQEKNFKFGLVMSEAFVRGIRDLGYKSSATAIDELIDNAYEAGASKVHIAFGFDGTASDKKPSEIAIIDNGSGMEPEMIRAAVTWGGTHRENSRAGLGRYGYGLPSSCMGIGRRYTVYSKIEGQAVSAVTIDLDEIVAGKYTTKEGDVVVPSPKTGKLPGFVDKYLQTAFPKGWESGTIIVIEKMDKLTWKTAGALQENLLRHSGVVYHKLRADLDIIVNGIRVEPIDPLFLTPGYRWFDLDEDRAQPLDPITVDVKNDGIPAGQVQVRISYLPPTFGSIDKGKKATAKNQNERYKVMQDYTGIIVARMGRIIDTVTRTSFTTFMNYDRFIKIEVDFPASLDEEFSVTTSKQQIVPSDRIWNILREGGLDKAIEQLRRKFKEENARYKEQREHSPKRASEEAMERTARLRGQLSPVIEEKQKEQGKKGLDQEARRRAAQSGRDVEEERKTLELQLTGRLYKVAYESMPGAPFFRMDMMGGTKVMFLNTATRFFQEVHSGPKSTPAIRNAIEVLLFAIGDRMLDTSDELRETYLHETGQWSQKLEYALAQLASNVGADDDHDDADVDDEDDAGGIESPLN